MHRAQHARDELVDSVALLHEGNKRRNTALVVPDISKVREYQLLELLDLILQLHQVRDCLVALVRIVYDFQTDVFFVLESAVKLGVLLMEGQLCKKKVDVFSNERAIPTSADLDEE